MTLTACPKLLHITVACTVGGGCCFTLPPHSCCQVLFYCGLQLCNSSMGKYTLFHLSERQWDDEGGCTAAACFTGTVPCMALPADMSHDVVCAVCACCHLSIPPPAIAAVPAATLTCDAAPGCIPWPNVYVGPGFGAGLEPDVQKRRAAAVRSWTSSKCYSAFQRCTNKAELTVLEKNAVRHCSWLPLHVSCPVFGGLCVDSLAQMWSCSLLSTAM